MAISEVDFLAEYLKLQEPAKAPEGNGKSSDMLDLTRQLLDAVKALSLEQQPIKGKPVTVFQAWQANGLSDVYVDCRNANRVNFQIFVTGTTPSATISIEAAAESGSNYIAIQDTNGSQASVTANDSFNAIVGEAWVKVRIASISGTFAYGQGFTVVVTPYVG